MSLQDWQAPPWPDPKTEKNCVECGVEFDGTNRSKMRQVILEPWREGPLCVNCEGKYPRLEPQLEPPRS